MGEEQAPGLVVATGVEERNFRGKTFDGGSEEPVENLLAGSEGGHHVAVEQHEVVFVFADIVGQCGEHRVVAVYVVDHGKRYRFLVVIEGGEVKRLDIVNIAGGRLPY